MTTPPRSLGRDLGPIAAAAHAFELALAQFELTAATAIRLPLDSQRNLDKATRAINEAAEGQRRVGEHIQVLMAALNEARDKNAVTAEKLRLRGPEIQAKVDQHGALLRRFEALGALARVISEAVRTIGKSADRTAATTLDDLLELDGRMATVVDAALVLAQAAQQTGHGELAREVEALHKQMQSARNKLKLVREKLAR